MICAIGTATTPCRCHQGACYLAHKWHERVVRDTRVKYTPLGVTTGASVHRSSPGGQHETRQGKAGTFIAHIHSSLDYYRQHIRQPTQQVHDAVRCLLDLVWSAITSLLEPALLHNCSQDHYPAWEPTAVHAGSKEHAMPSPDLQM